MPRFPKYAISKRVESKRKGVRYTRLVSVLRAPSIDAVIKKFLRVSRPKGEYVVVRLVKDGNVGKVRRTFNV